MTRCAPRVRSGLKRYLNRKGGSARRTGQAGGKLNAAAEQTILPIPSAHRVEQFARVVTNAVLKNNLDVLHIFNCDGWIALVISSPSRLNNDHDVLVIDASVAINLLGTGRPLDLLRMLNRKVLVDEIALEGSNQRSIHQGFRPGSNGSTYALRVDFPCAA